MDSTYILHTILLLGFFFLAQTEFTKVDANSTFAKLQPGDICQIVAPLSPGFYSTVDELKLAVSSIGLTPSISNDFYNVSGPDVDYPWYSNTDEFRAQDLASAILNPEVKVIWFVNGGSGAFRTLEHLVKLLPPPPLPSAPKYLIGFSASTPIFTYLQQEYNWPVIHGALLDLIVGGYYENSTYVSVEPLKQILFGTFEEGLILPTLTRVDDGDPWEEPLVSTVTGGSMRQTVLSLGTSYKLNATGKILFLEVSESTADSTNDFIDAMIYSGGFEGVTAIVFGDFMADNNEPESHVQWILDRIATEGKVTAPIFRVRGLGHGFTNFPLPFNIEAKIRHVSGKSYSLTVSV